MSGVLVFALVGCSHPRASVPSASGDVSAVAQPSLSPDQAAAISDNEVTREEYELGFQRYVSCVAQSGYTIVIRGEDHDLIDFAVPGDAVTSGVDERCYTLEFAQIDAAWQIAHEDSSAAAEALARCLRDAGIEPKPTVREMNEQLDAAKLTPADCS